MSLLSVTLIGTFRKEQEKLREVYEYISKNYNLVSPKGVNFVDLKVDFVRLPDEVNQKAHTIEERVLSSIRESDAVWLFAPGGYVGHSAAFEIGFAYSIGVPIFTKEPLQDEMLETMVVSGADIKRLPREVHKPGKGVAGLQSYYKRASTRRGWGDESAKDTLLLITEELGELARATRKNEHIKRDHEYSDQDVAEELADLQLYLVHLANILSVDLGDAVTQKEIKNEQRYRKKKTNSGQNLSL